MDLLCCVSAVDCLVLVVLSIGSEFTTQAGRAISGNDNTTSFDNVSVFTIISTLMGNQKSLL